MAVVFAVVGGGAIVGIATSDPYSDHSDYSNYGDYSNYSDAAERRSRRIAAKKEEIETTEQMIDQYKISKVNDYLDDRQLINEKGRTVSLYAVKNNGDSKLNHNERQAVIAQTKERQQEIEEIDAAIATIDTILEECKK